MKKFYNHLEHLHKNYGLFLHGSVFIFSLFLGISLGILVLFITQAQAVEKNKQMKQYESQIMNQLVKKIEASTPR